MQVGRSNLHLEILATDWDHGLTDKRGDGPALGIHFAAAASPSKQVMTASKTV